MIDEIYPMFCKRGLSRFPAPGNPRGRKFDLFSARQGSPINFGRIYENWASDTFSIKLTNEDLNAAGRNLTEYIFGKGRFVSNKAVMGMRSGNTDDVITIFQNTYFILKFNGCEKYRFRGWDEGMRDFYWRLEGGESLEMSIYSEGAIVMPEGSFIFLDLVVLYEPQALILAQERTAINISNLPDAESEI